MKNEALIARLLELDFVPYDIKASAAKAGKLKIEYEAVDTEFEPAPSDKKVVPMLAKDEPCFFTICIGDGGRTLAFVDDACYMKREIVDLEPHGFTNPFKRQLAN